MKAKPTVAFLRNLRDIMYKSPFPSMGRLAQCLKMPLRTLYYQVSELRKSDIDVVIYNRKDGYSILVGPWCSQIDNKYWVKCKFKCYYPHARLRKADALLRRGNHVAYHAIVSEVSSYMYAKNEIKECNNDPPPLLNNPYPPLIRYKRNILLSTVTDSKKDKDFSSEKAEKKLLIPLLGVPKNWRQRDLVGHYFADTSIVLEQINLACKKLGTLRYPYTYKTLAPLAQAMRAGYTRVDLLRVTKCKLDNALHKPAKAIYVNPYSIGNVKTMLTTLDYLSKYPPWRHPNDFRGLVDVAKDHIVVLKNEKRLPDVPMPNPRLPIDNRPRPMPVPDGHYDWIRQGRTQAEQQAALDFFALMRQKLHIEGEAV